MSGILYENFCVNQLSVIFSCYSILFTITRSWIEEKSEAKLHRMNNLVNIE